MRVMLDTNVLISAIIFPNNRMNSLIYKATVDHQLVLSSYIIEELLEVTERKFMDRMTAVDLFLTRLPYELVYTPRERQTGLFIIRDADDYPALYSAILESVDLFVSGDNDFEDIDIETPRQRNLTFLFNGFAVWPCGETLEIYMYIYYQSGFIKRNLFFPSSFVSADQSDLGLRSDVSFVVVFLIFFYIEEVLLNLVIENKL